MKTLTLCFLRGPLMQALVGVLLPVAAGFYPTETTAQSHFNRHYSTPEGLSSNTLFCVFQDSEGYLWLGSDQGVCRYNGSSFTHFTIADGLTDNDVLEIAEDSQGRIWFLTYGGSPCFYQDGSFHNPGNSDLLQGMQVKGYFSCFHEHSDGTVYLGSHFSDVLVVRPDGSSEINRQWNIVDRQALENLWEHNGDLMGAHHPRAFSNYTREKRLNTPFPNANPKDKWRSYFTDGTLYLGFNDTLYALDEQFRITGQVGLPEEESVTYIGAGYYAHEVALGTTHGLRYVTKGSMELSPVHLPGRVVTYACRDREDGFWVSTLDDGLFYAQRQNMLVFPLESRPHRTVHSLEVVGDTLWFGLDELHYGAVVNDSVVLYASLGKPDAVTGQNRVLGFPEVDGDRMVLVEKLLVEKTINNPRIKTKFPFHSVTSITRDYEGRTWVGGLFGLARVTRDQDGLVVREEPKTAMLPGNPVYAMARHRGSSALVGTNDGVMQVHLPSGNLEPIFPETRQKRISALEELPGNRLLVATMGWGLFVYKDNQLIARLTDSRYPSVTNRLRKDGSGRLWFAAQSGIYQLANPTDPVNRWEWRCLNSTHGLASEEVEDIAFFGGRIYAASAPGIIALDSSHFHLRKTPPVLQLVSLGMADSTVRVGHGQEPLHIPGVPVSVHCDAISFSTGDLEYRYQLNDHPPVFTSSSEFHLAALPPGKNRLQLAVRRDRSNWSQTRVLYLAVPFPWWQTAGLIALSAVALVGLVLLLWRWKGRQKWHLPKRDKSSRSILPQTLTVKTNAETLKLPTSQILWIKSEANYCSVVTDDKRHLVLATLKSFEEQLAREANFLRIHRSYIVNLRHVSGAKMNQVTIADTQIAVGGTYRATYRRFYDSYIN